MPQIIGIVGFIGSGKDTVAQCLVNNYNFKQVSFADPLKDAVSSIFHWPREFLEGDTKESRNWREQEDTWWSTRLGIPGFSPRMALQQWGTEVARRGFHDDIWIASLEYSILGEIHGKFVMSDCRFQNEINMIEKLGGFTIRVSKGQDPEWTLIQYDDIKDLRKYMTLYYPEVHASEYEWTLHPHKYHIENNGTIADLHLAIDQIMLSHIGD